MAKFSVGRTSLCPLETQVIYTFIVPTNRLSWSFLRKTRWAHSPPLGGYWNRLLQAETNKERVREMGVK